MALLEINWNPPRKDTRQFALIWFPLLCGIIGFLMWRNTRSIYWALPPLIAPVLLSPAAYLSAEFGRRFFITWIVVSYPIGWVVSHTLMAVIFYLLITPMGLLMRLFGRDAMSRRLRSGQASYWTRHTQTKHHKQYFRQY